MSEETCKSCSSKNLKKFGKNKVGNQRFRCLDCARTFSVSNNQKDQETKLVVAETTTKGIFDEALVFSTPTPKNLPVKNLDFLTPQEIHEQKRQTAIRKVAEADKSALTMGRDDIDYSIGDKDT